MKILYLTNARLPTEKAYGAAIMQQCEAFAEIGHEVVLAHGRRKNSITTDVFSYYAIKKKFTVQPLFLLDVLRFRMLGKLGYYVNTVSFLPSALLFALRKQPDVIYTRDDFTAFILSIFFSNVYWEAHTARMSWYLGLMHKKTRGLVYISNGLKDYYERRYLPEPKKVLVAPSAIDPSRFDVSTEEIATLREKLNIPTEKIIIGHIGKTTTMGQSKGVDVLVNAFCHVQKENHKVFLLLVGLEEEEKLVFAKQLDALNVQVGSYKLIGHVPQGQVPVYLKMCNCLVMCYPNTEHYRLYMSPLKLFEYMACGVPMVSTDLPSIREVLCEDEAMFATIGNTTGIARCIVDTIGNEKLSSVRANNAYRKMIEKYTWLIRARRISVLISAQS